MARNYSFEKVDITPGEVRKAAWTFAGEHMSGEEASYAVTDRNFPGRNQWEFIVRTPRGRDARIEVRPRSAPNVKVWAELPDRSLTFSRSTKAPHTGKHYCQVALADTRGERTKVVVKSGQRDRLPRWFGSKASRMRSKETVRHTRGTDGDSLVALVPAGDHEEMIRMFFATKVWTLKEAFVLGD